MVPRYMGAAAHVLRCLLLSCGVAGVMAQQPAPPPVMPEPAPLIHPWQVPPPQGGAQAYFSNLQDGDKIETPYLLKFGLAGGWGLAPIAKPIAGKSGHHHLLINRDLPLDFKNPLPFNDQYIHFGKGQMETVLNLPPGKYTLRLLLADHLHLPHFVYSKPVTITVTRKNATDPQSLVVKGISMATAGATLKTPLQIRFHASGLNVGHAAQKEKDTGHFRLTMTPQGKGNAETLDFANGQTEVWLAPPAGDYALRLEFVDNLNPQNTLTPAVTSNIKVQ